MNPAAGWPQAFRRRTDAMRQPILALAAIITLPLSCAAPTLAWELDGVKQVAPFPADERIEIEGPDRWIARLTIR